MRHLTKGMETRSPSTDTRKVYALGIAVCAVTLLIFALFAAAEPSYAAGDFGLKAAAPEALRTQTSVPKIIGNVINAALGLVGVVFLILMIYAGIRWMTARGKSEYAETAKDTITRAIIGLIIIAAAYAITSFVLNRVTGSVDTTGSAGSSAPPAPSCVVGTPCTSDTDCNGGQCGFPDAITKKRLCSCIGV